MVSLTKDGSWGHPRCGGDSLPKDGSQQVVGTASLRSQHRVGTASLMIGSNKWWGQPPKDGSQHRMGTSTHQWYIPPYLSDEFVQYSLHVSCCATAG
jgi:hypothetical protein